MVHETYTAIAPPKKLEKLAEEIFSPNGKTLAVIKENRNLVIFYLDMPIRIYNIIKNHLNFEQLIILKLIFDKKTLTLKNCNDNQQKIHNTLPEELRILLVENGNIDLELKKPE
jgi:hypothetical protein